MHRHNSSGMPRALILWTGRSSHNHTKLQLADAGFVDIKEEVIRLPLNGRPAGPPGRDLGRWFDLGIQQACQPLSLALSIEAVARPLRRFAISLKTLGSSFTAILSDVHYHRAGHISERATFACDAPPLPSTPIFSSTEHVSSLKGSKDNLGY